MTKRSKSRTKMSVGGIIARDFLNHFLPEDRETCVHTFQALDDARNNNTRPEIFCEETFNAKLDAKFQKMNAHGAGIFFTPNRQDGEGRSIDNTIAIRAVFADLDEGCPVPDEPLEGWPIEPNVVVQSSPGKFQVYWLIDDDDKMDHADFIGVQQCLALDYGSDMAVHDPCRLMRVPGYSNMKAKYDEPEVTVVYTDADYYTVADILEAFPPLELITQEDADEALEEWRGHSDTTQPGDVEAALGYLADGEFVDDYDHWHKFGWAIMRSFGDAGYNMWRNWSKQSDKFDEDGCKLKWKQLSRDADKAGSSGLPVRIGSIFHLAIEQGYQPPKRARMDTVDELLLDEPVYKETAIEFGLRISATGAWEGDPNSDDEEMQDPVAAMMTRMNAEHAYVELRGGGQFLLRTAKEDAEDDDAHKYELGFVNQASLKLRYQAIAIPVQEGKTTKFKNPADLWCCWPNRQHYEGVGFYPGSNTRVPRGHLNLWIGFGIDPSGEPHKCNLLLEHIRENICDSNDEHNKWLLDWLAHCVQKPEEKPLSAIVLKSPERGTGKSTIFNVMRKILGKHALPVSQAGQITGRFNSHLREAIILGAEEAFWAGDKGAEGTLKDLITGKHISIEQKGKDLVSVRNYTRLIITSNNDWVIPATFNGERRFFVAAVRSDYKSKAKMDAYFKRLYKQLENEGGYEAFFQFLLDREITSNLMRPPETEALREQQLQSLDSKSQWLKHIAEEGYVAGENGDEYVFNVKEGTRINKADVYASAKIFFKGYEQNRLQQEIGKLMKSLGVSGDQRTSSRHGSKRAFEFPKLAAFRDVVSEFLRTPINA